MSTEVLDALWARHIGGTADDRGYSVTTDIQGNVYVIGSYISTKLTIYQSTDNTGSSFDLSNAGGTDAFIVKYDTSGTSQWARHIGGTSTDIGYGIAADSQGNVYVTGSYNSTTLKVYSSLDNTTSFFDLSTAGSTDAFIVKYDTSGTAQWARHIGGTSSDEGNAIATDSQGNVYVTGSYGSITLKIYSSLDNTTSFFDLSNAGTSNAFVVKYDTNGTAQWARHIGGTIINIGYGIAADSQGNVYVTGSYNSTTLKVYSSLDNTTSFFDLSTAGSSDTFIVKYNTSGTAQWARHIGGTSADIGYEIAADSQGNVYVTGFYNSTTLKVYSSLDNTTSFFDLSNASSSDAFIVKYDTLGTAQWARHIGGTSGDIGYGIAADSQGNVYVTGSYSSTTLKVYSSLDNTTSFFDLSNAGPPDAFIVKYDTNGTAQFARHIGGISTDIGYGIAADSQGNVYVTGYYISPTLTIFPSTDNSGSVFDLSNAGIYDIFIVKYRTSELPPTPTPSPLIICCTNPEQLCGLSTDTNASVIERRSESITLAGNYLNGDIRSVDYSTWIKIKQGLLYVGRR
jgi:hypothetical protein